MNDDMATEIYRKLSIWAENDSVGMIVIQGQNGFFCGGADMDWLAAHRSEAAQLYGSLGDVYQLISEYPKPIVAMMNGDTSGSGFGLANTRFRLATDGARFSVPEPSFGLVPDGPALKMLVKCDELSGLPAANYLALSGQPVSSDEMMMLGIASHQIGDDEEALARQIAAVSWGKDKLHGSELEKVLDLYCDWKTSGGLNSRAEALLEEAGGDMDCAPKLWPGEEQKVIEAFGCDSLVETWERLEALPGPFAQAALGGLQAAAPISLLATQRLIQEAKRKPSTAAFSALSARVASRLANGPAFAKVIEHATSDSQPPATSLDDLKAVSEDQVSSLFTP